MKQKALCTTNNVDQEHRMCRWRGALALRLALCALAATVSANAQKHATFTTFDSGANPTSINPAGLITGYYYQPSDNVNYHGFLRTRDGTITMFDAPGSAPGPGTFPTSISPAGEITGYYVYSAVFRPHGFLRTPDGTITTFDAPDSTSTVPTSINPDGVVAGWYGDLRTLEHGFLRAPDGTITTFVVPGAEATTATSINPAGWITGVYSVVIDGTSTLHGFVRAHDGAITTFDCPNSHYFTSPASINPAGGIAGYCDDLKGHTHGFVRARDGTITLFDIVGARETLGVGINPGGEITGYYYLDVNGYGPYGFVRARDGTITTFDAAGSESFTLPASINPAGQVTGQFWKGIPPNISGAFLRSPHGN